MKRKTILIAFLLQLLMIGNTFAQQEVFVSGKVIDAIDKLGLESTAVGFYNDKDKLIAGTVTDSKGFFELALARGKYKMVIDYIGYEKQNHKVMISKNNQFLGTYKLKDAANQLGTVQIKGQNKRFKVDKDVYIVTHKMKVSAANTNDVLDKIKGVTYDRYNNSIKVDGQTNIKILVNGLEKNQEYVQNLNPDRIKKIEVIRDPSGKYGLDGYSAVVNVILKMNYSGTELSFTNQSVLDPDTADSKYLLPMNYLSLGYNYTYNKLNVYTKYSQYTSDFLFPTYQTQKYNSGGKIEKTTLNNTPNSSKNSINDQLVLGADYYINPQHTISFETNMRNLLFNYDKARTSFNVNEYYGQTLVNNYALQNTSENESQSSYQSVFYIGKLSEINSINIDATLSQYKQNDETINLHNHNLERKEIGNTGQNKFRLNAEFTHLLNEKSSIQVGYGYLHLKNTTELLSIQPAQNDQHYNTSYKDTRHKLFSYYATKFGKKLSIKIGIAGEISQPEALGESPTYFIYQPHFDAKYKLSKLIDLKLKYRSESDYPGLSQVNPNEVYLDAQTVSKGNPHLKPSVTHKLSFRTNIYNGVISLEPYYHFSNSYIGQVGKLRSDGIVEYTYDNVGDYKHYGIKGNFVIPFTKSLFWQNNFDYYHSSITYNNKQNAFNDININSNLMYVNKKSGLTSGFILQKSMNKHIATQGYNRWNNDFLGFLIQKPFLKRKLNIMLMYMLPIEHSAIRYKQEQWVETPTYSSLTVQDISVIKNVFIFRVNYRFAKGKTTRKVQKDIDEETPGNTKKGLF